MATIWRQSKAQVYCWPPTSLSGLEMHYTDKSRNKMTTELYDVNSKVKACGLSNTMLYWLPKTLGNKKNKTKIEILHFVLVKSIKFLNFFLYYYYWFEKPNTLWTNQGISFFEKRKGTKKPKQRESRVTKSRHKFSRL